MNTKELREKSVTDLQALKKEVQKEQFNLRMQAGTRALAKTHLVKQARRNVARIETILTEKKGAN